MSDPITPELFAHLVQLAALELSAEEGEYLRRQLNNQLKAIHELEAIPLGPETTVTSHGVPYTPETIPPIRQDVLRFDAQQPAPTPDAILKQAPQTEENYIVVPDIKHTDLS